MKQSRIAKIKDKIKLDTPIIDCFLPSMLKPLLLLDKFLSTDETRFFLHGFYWNPEKVAFVASDGRRLAMLDLSKDKDKLPADLFKLEAGIYLISFDKGMRHHRTFSILYKIDGCFPNYEKIIPAIETMDHIGTEGNCTFGTSNLCRIIYQKATFNIDTLIDLEAEKRAYKIFCSKEDPKKHAFLLTSDNLTICAMPLIDSH
jgi:hypothetical protein